MLVQVLTFEGCPHRDPAIDLVHRIIREVDVAADVRVVDVSAADVEDLQFLGSPSIRVDGRDIEPAAATRRAYGYGCRRYATAQGVRPLPDEAWLRAALAAARP